MNNENQVKIHQGVLEGKKEDGILKFYGIPYAQPPVAQLRWSPPQPVKPWEGVKSATSFSPVSPQFAGAVYTERSKAQSEDCLYLNVWTQNTCESAKQPVMVWIHGGGFLGGSGSEDGYDGTAFAKKGVTLVTLNYRLGAFGFLAEPTIGANFGIQDIIAALVWVKNNIAAFGGDPSNVTVFGQSAGAVAIRALLSCPSAEGLFQRAIIQSAGRLRADKYALTSQESEKVLEALHYVAADELQNIPTMAILKASSEMSGLPPKPGRVHTPENLVWSPVVDGVVIPDISYQPWIKDIQVMIGCTENEGRYFLKPEIHNNPAMLEGMALALAGTEKNAILAQLEKNNSSVFEKLDYLMTRYVFSVPALEMANDITQIGASVYLYRFSRTAPGAVANNERAKHTSEIRYVFGNLENSDFYEQADYSLAEEMQTAWIEFASKGVPLCRDYTWPKYQMQKPAMTDITDEMRETVSAHLFD